MSDSGIFSLFVRWPRSTTVDVVLVSPKMTIAELRRTTIERRLVQLGVPAATEMRRGLEDSGGSAAAMDARRSFEMAEVLVELVHEGVILVGEELSVEASGVNDGDEIRPVLRASSHEELPPVGRLLLSKVVEPSLRSSPKKTSKSKKAVDAALDQRGNHSKKHINHADGSFQCWSCCGSNDPSPFSPCRAKDRASPAELPSYASPLVARTLSREPGSTTAAVTTAAAAVSSKGGRLPASVEGPALMRESVETAVAALGTALSLLLRAKAFEGPDLIASRPETRMDRAVALLLPPSDSYCQYSEPGKHQDDEDDVDGQERGMRRPGAAARRSGQRQLWTENFSEDYLRFAFGKHALDAVGGCSPHYSKEVDFDGFFKDWQCCGGLDANPMSDCRAAVGSPWAERDPWNMQYLTKHLVETAAGLLGRARALRFHFGQEEAGGSGGGGGQEKE
eukprot:g1028.t1